MSIATAVAQSSTTKFVLPCAGKMFKSNISKKDKALCFVLNKGYFETEKLDDMLALLSDVADIKDLILVGSINKVRLKRTRKIVYRQRLFIKSLGVLLRLCKVDGIWFEVSRNFRITTNNLMNCRDELVLLERYARRFDETIDTWLTNCCLIELYYYLKSMNIHTNLKHFVQNRLKDKVDYLDRAPFLISSYDIEKKTSGIFLDFEDDVRLYDEVGTSLLDIGYTDSNVKKDIKNRKRASHLTREGSLIGGGKKG